MSNWSEFNLSREVRKKNNTRSYTCHNSEFFSKEFERALIHVKEVNSDVYFEQKLKILGNKICTGRNNYNKFNKKYDHHQKVEEGGINWVIILECFAFGVILFLLYYYQRSN